MQDTRHISCLVVDDEPPARAVIQRYIEQMPLLRLAGSCGNAMEAMSMLSSQPIDLLFLDINMPQIKGTDLLRIIKNPPKVILTTAYPEYALEGYELDVIDYLLKPIQFERFLKAINKVSEVSRPSEEPEIKKEAGDFIYFRCDRKMVKVHLNDILYVESMKDYIKVFTKEGQIVTKQSIASLEEMLPEHQFIRSHRSFIVSLSKIKSFTSEIIEIGNMELPIGKLYRQTTLKSLQG